MATDNDNDNRFECPCLGKCSFFQSHETKMPALVAKLKAQYCLSDNTNCARLWVREEVGAEQVPMQMMPHQLEWAEQILHDAGKTISVYKRKAKAASC